MSYVGAASFVAGTGRLVILGFPIETVYPEGIRTALVGRAMGFLLEDLCIDGDGDGYSPDGGGTCGPVDCDDGAPEVNPGTQEICTEGVDDDCDGWVDDDDPDCAAEFTLAVDVHFEAARLDLVLTLDAAVPTTWANYLVLTEPSVQIVPLWTVPIPVIDPVISIPIGFPLPGLGLIGIWTGLFTEAGVQAVELVWVETGAP